jgi:hypothetical protein
MNTCRKLREMSVGGLLNLLLRLSLLALSIDQRRPMGG